jgi:hypothetical protein
VYFHFPVAARALGLTVARFRPVHFVLTLVVGVVFGMLAITVTIAGLLDELFFPGYRRQAIVQPIYIVATPRSGTTFLHRLMCLDERFTWLKLYHTLLPSALLMKGLQLLSRLDRRIGSPLHRLNQWASARAFNGWKGIHDTGFDRAEEDEMVWLFSMLSPGLVLLFPWPADFPEALYPDRLPDRSRRKLSAWYGRFLRKHAHVVGRGRTLLAKNALIAGRVEATLAAVPDARFVHLVRHPYEAIPSLLSMFTMPWWTHSPQLRRDGPEVKALAEMTVEYYLRMGRLEEELGPERVVTVRYDALMADPEGTVARIYTRLGLGMDDGLRARLRQELATARDFRSGHQYSLEEYGLSRDWVFERLPDVFASHGFDR